MTQRNAIPLTSLVILFCSVTCVYAGPTYWETNGHYYERIEAPYIDWEDACADASGRSYLGVPGHLITITSASEQQFLANNSLLPAEGVPNHRYWIGGHQPPGSPEPSGNWQWVTGEAWHYSNWGNNEPNNSGSQNEDAADLGPSGYWNDLNRNTSGAGGYFIEYPVPDYSAKVDEYVVTTKTARLGKWNGSSFEAVGAGSITTGNVHILVHGWTPGAVGHVESGTAIWDTEEFGGKWNEMAGVITANDPGCTVLMFDWMNMSATEKIWQPYKSQANTRDAGDLLAAALQEACDLSSSSLKTHIIAHSHGVGVTGKAALELAENGDVVNHLTFLDSPESAIAALAGARNIMSYYIGANTALGQQIVNGSTFLDNYFVGNEFARIGISHGDLEVGVELDTPYGLFDMDNINTDEDFFMFSQNHNYPVEWYTKATGSLLGDALGLHWSPLLGDRFESLESFYKQMWRNPVTGDLIPELEHSLVSGTGDVVGMPDTLYRYLLAEHLATEGTVVIDTEGFGATLTENSPAYWHSVIEIDENDVFLEFVYQFLEVGDGDELGIWIDGELRYLAVGNITGTDTETGFIDISYLDSGTHMLSVALHSTGESGASVHVGQFSVVATVPEPSAFMILFTGLIGLAILYRRVF